MKDKHTVKFGFQYYKGHYRRLDCNNCPGTVNFSPNATGNPGVSGQTGANYAAFLLGLANGGSFNYSADIDFFFPYYAWFVQDDVKVNRKLTFSLGLRYEMPVFEAGSRFQNSNFCPSCLNPAAGNLARRDDLCRNAVRAAADLDRFGRYAYERLRSARGFCLIR